MLKLADDITAPPIGGLYYNASEDSLHDETAARPNLVVTYDEPGVTLNPPTTINASGAELSWSKYIDPTPVDDDDLIEYQIFRGCRALPAPGCASPVGDYFSTTSPGALTLVGTVPPEVTSFTDTTAKPSTATELAKYSYWVVARTVGDGTSNGKAASNVQAVTMPREGRIMQSFGGDISDTTLSASKPDDNLQRPDGPVPGGPPNTRYWVQVGNNHPTYGVERGVFEFDTSSIKLGTKITDARVELFSNYGSGTGQADFDLYALARDFTEDQATWKQAESTINWTAPGGDYDSTKLLGSIRPDDNPQRLTFASTGITSNLVTKLQTWVDNPGDNHGLLLKTQKEAADATGQQLLSITNGESPDTLFRPRLWIEHLAKNEAETGLEPCDAANAGWYYGDGDKRNGTISAAGALPIAGILATLTKWYKGARALKELPSGPAASVVRNALEAHEVAQAQKIVDFRGGKFVGNKSRSFPGIDGFLNGVPASLKRIAVRRRQVCSLMRLVPKSRQEVLVIQVSNFS